MEQKYKGTKFFISSHYKCTIVLWIDRRQDDFFPLIYRFYLFKILRLVSHRATLVLICSVKFIHDLWFFFLVHSFHFTLYWLALCGLLLIVLNIFHSGWNREIGRHFCVTVSCGKTCYSFRLPFISYSDSEGYWIESQNYRFTKVGKDLQGDLVQPSTYHQYCPINHVPEYHIHPFLKHPQGGWLHHFPRQSVPIPDHSFWE